MKIETITKRYGKKEYKMYTTKIDIFSGFLGAGKTTLIKKLLKEAYCGEQLVLIENEFGEIGIDGGFMQDAGIRVTEMNSGCICCSLVGDFGRALRKVLDEYHPDRILIEPSGVGKLSDIIRAVRDVAPEGAVLNGFTTVVDVGKCKMYMRNFGEFFNDQIENAGCIVLSHTGKASGAKVEEAVHLLREHNPTAVIVTTPWEQLEGRQLLSAMERRDTIEQELARLAEETSEERHGHGEGCCHHHDRDGEHGHCHHDGEEHGHCHHHDGEEPGHCRHHEEQDGEEGHCCHDHEGHGHHPHGEGEECDDPDCCCHHHHDHDGGHDHHHHHADEVFVSWGVETARTFAADELRDILEALPEEPKYGVVLRAKGIVEASDGGWLHFDYVPGEPDVRRGSAGVTGRLCVIGSGLNEDALAELFGVARN